MLAALPERPHVAPGAGDLRVGSRFAGHRIDAIAGRGGMGVVYRATQLTLDRTVALKVVAPVLQSDPVIRERFIREARSTASLEHPNVIPIYYEGEQDGVGYIAMRHIDGDDLRSLVRRDGPLAPIRAAMLVEQVAAALDAAHAAGLVHRDVKPANALLGAGDHVYLTDFGLTKIASAATHTGGGWVGTIDYVAPEQIRGERVDARTDVYALGCVLFFLLTGRVPFTGDGHERKLWAHLTESPPPTGRAALDRVIARAMAKRPAHRYPSAGDLGRAALAAAAGEKPAGPERSVATGAAAALDRRRPRRRIATALAALAATAAGLLALPAKPPDVPAITPAAAAPTATPAPPLRSIPMAHQANALAPASGRLWIASHALANLRGIDPRRVALVHATPHIGRGVVDIATHGNLLWSARAWTSTVSAVDVRTGTQVVGPIPVGLKPVAIDADAGGAWVGINLAVPRVSELVRVGRASGQVERTFAVSGGVQSVRAYAGSVWVATDTSHRLLRLDPGTGRVEHAYPLSAGGVGDIATGGGAVWVTLAGQGRLARIDVRTGRKRVVNTGRLPWGVVYDRGSVYVANRGSSTVSRFDAGTLRPKRPSIHVPPDPFVLAVAGRDVWVSCLGARKIVRLPPG